MDVDLPPDIARRLDDACAHLASLSSGTADAFRPESVDAIRAAGLHLLTLPHDMGGLGAGLATSVLALARIAAVDGSTALGLAMHTHITGSAVESAVWPEIPFRRLREAIASEGAMVNAASSEEGSGSPARGGLPDTRAVRIGDTYRVTGEKTFTTWLPALRFALVSALLVDGGGAGEASAGGGDGSAAGVPGDAPDISAGRATPGTPDEPLVGNLLVDLESSGVERLAGFEALGMRGSASGRLRLTEVEVPAAMLVLARRGREPDPRGASPQGWFGACLAGVYLGVGEGARSSVVRWAIDRRPGDGSTAVVDLPTVQVRLGRLDAALRAARIVLLDVTRRWDATAPDARFGLMADITLAKIQATNAAVLATDEALRIAGGPGFLAGPIERAFRDARAGLINPPLDDVAYQGFAKVLADRERGGG